MGHLKLPKTKRSKYTEEELLLLFEWESICTELNSWWSESTNEQKELLIIAIRNATDSIASKMPITFISK